MLQDSGNESASARVSLLALMVAEQRGVGRDELLAAVGVDRDAFLDEDARVPVQVEQAIWREATERTKTPLFGVETISSAPPGFLGLPEMMFASAGTLRDALHTCQQYMPLVREGITVRIEDDEAQRDAKVSYVWSEAAAEPTASLDFIMGACVVMARYFGAAPNITRICFSSPAPLGNRDDAARARFFGIDAIDYDAGEIAVVFDRRALDAPSLASAPRLNGLLRSHADQLLSELGRRPSFVLRARRQLVAAVEAGTPTLPALARRLSMSTRSLQRRLADQGSSFAELLDDVRRELAIHYLKGSSLSLGEVAFRLGFSSPQSFHRAFRDWTGEAPGAYRRAHIAARMT